MILEGVSHGGKPVDSEMPFVAIALFVMLTLSQEHIEPFDRVLGPDAREGQEIPEDLVSRTWYGAIVDGYCSGGLPSRP